MIIFGDLIVGAVATITSLLGIIVDFLIDRTISSSLKVLNSKFMLYREFTSTRLCRKWKY